MEKRHKHRRWRRLPGRRGACGWRLRRSGCASSGTKLTCAAGCCLLLASSRKSTDSGIISSRLFCPQSRLPGAKPDRRCRGTSGRQKEGPPVQLSANPLIVADGYELSTKRGCMLAAVRQHARRVRTCCETSSTTTPAHFYNAASHTGCSEK